MSNIGLDQDSIHSAEASTQKLVDSVTKHNGTYYLTYQLFPTKTQLQTAYPNIDKFFALKKKYDPEEVFMNDFYAKYAKGETIEYGKQ